MEDEGRSVTDSSTTGAFVVRCRPRCVGRCSFPSLVGKVRFVVRNASRYTESHERIHGICARRFLPEGNGELIYCRIVGEGCQAHSVGQASTIRTHPGADAQLGVRELQPHVFALEQVELAHASRVHPDVSAEPVPIGAIDRLRANLRHGYRRCACTAGGRAAAAKCAAVVPIPSA